MATLSLHSLFELRKCIEKGTIMLDMEASTLPQVVGELPAHKLLIQNPRQTLKKMLKGFSFRGIFFQCFHLNGHLVEQASATFPCQIFLNPHLILSRPYGDDCSVTAGL